MAGCNRGEACLVSQEEEGPMCQPEMAVTKGHICFEAVTLGKKYGGLVPKKKPLISKDNERAFFDSADWALGKQGAGLGQQSKAVVETLRPKLQRTPHQQLPPRRPTCKSDRDGLAE